MQSWRPQGGHPCQRGAGPTQQQEWALEEIAAADAAAAAAVVAEGVAEGVAEVEGAVVVRAAFAAEAAVGAVGAVAAAEIAGMQANRPTGLGAGTAVAAGVVVGMAERQANCAVAGATCVPVGGFAAGGGAAAGPVQQCRMGLGASSSRAAWHALGQVAASWDTAGQARHSQRAGIARLQGCQQMRALAAAAAAEAAAEAAVAEAAAAEAAEAAVVDVVAVAPATVLGCSRRHHQHHHHRCRHHRRQCALAPAPALRVAVPGCFLPVQRAPRPERQHVLARALRWSQTQQWRPVRRLQGCGAGPGHPLLLR